MKIYTVALLLLLFLKPLTGHRGHGYHMRNWKRGLEDSFLDSLKKHMKSVGESTKKMMHKHLGMESKSGTKITQTNGDKSTVIQIKNGVKITKTYKNGKLIHTKKEKVKNRGNQINMINSGNGKSIISMNGGGKHVTRDKNGNIQINESGSSHSHGKHTKHHRSKKDKKKKDKEKKKKKEKEEKEEKKNEKAKHLKDKFHALINKFTRSSAKVSSALVAALIVTLM